MNGTSRIVTLLGCGIAVKIGKCCRWDGMGWEEEERLML
jgi:hypothetical protein